jgi:hypothetical protein
MRGVCCLKVGGDSASRANQKPIRRGIDGQQKGLVLWPRYKIKWEVPMYSHQHLSFSEGVSIDRPMQRVRRSLPILLCLCCCRPCERVFDSQLAFALRPRLFSYYQMVGILQVVAGIAGYMC